MKPPPFEYVAPETLDEALAELAAHDGEARPLAGGQSLVPLLNFRLAYPSLLIDVNGISELSRVTISPRAVDVGAVVRTAELLSPDVREAVPLAAEAARLVGHPQIRFRGTVGGSVAHADPAAELPAAAVLLGATVRLASRRGPRDVEAESFFTGLFSTACEWDEIVVGVVFPRLGSEFGWGFREFARRPGDFALAGVGTILSLDGDKVASIRVVAFGLGSTPLRARRAEAALAGRVLDSDALEDARAVLAEEVAPSDSLHGSGAYRRHLAGVLLQRALEDAASKAAQERSVSTWRS